MTLADPPHSTRRRILHELLAIFLMGAAVAAVYWNPIPDGMSTLASDWHQLHKVRMRYAREAIFSDHPRLPAWYTPELLGAPFWSNIQSFPFIPNRLLVVFAFDPDGKYAFTVGVTLSALLAALATYLFARTLRLGLTASAAAGFSFAACGYFSSRVAAGHLPLLEVYFALPLVLWAVEWLAQRFEQSRSIRLPILAIGATCFCIMLAGHPQLPIYSLACGGVYAIWRLGIRRCIWGIVPMGLGMGIAGFVLVPMAMLVKRSTRVLPLNAPDNDLAMPYRRLMGFFSPWFDGAASPLDRSIADPFRGYANNAYFWDTVCFIGWLPWLALIGLIVLCLVPATRRRLSRPTLFLIVAGVLSLILSLPLIQQITSQLKGTYLRSPARLLYIAEFSLAMALAAGVQAMLRARLPLWVKAAVPVLLVLHGAQLWALGREFLMNKSYVFDHESSTVEDMLQFVRERRVAIDMELPLRPLRKVDDVGFFDSVMLAKPYQFIMDLGLAPPGLNIQNMNGSVLNQRALEAAGVQYVVTFHPMSLPLFSRLPHALIYAIEAPHRRVQFYNLDQTYYAAISDLHQALRDPRIDLRTTLILPGERPALQDSPGSGNAYIDYRRPDSDAIEATVEAPRPGFVRFIESWDPGWSVTVDGTPAKVEQAYDALLAVLVPAGKHEIRFEYHTPGAKTGAAVSIASLLALSCLMWAAKREQAPSATAVAE